jgi:purine-binding chemotaxis protein CheW
MSINDEQTVLRAGKYLTFQLEEEEFGIDIMLVKTIIGLMDITKVPKMPDYVRGVINLRGMIIPVVDLRLKFGMDTVENTRETTIIVVEVNFENRQDQIGVLVDRVREVLDITEGDIEDAPTLGASMDTNFIIGMAKTKKRVISLLSIEKVLSMQDIVKLSKLSQNEE